MSKQIPDGWRFGKLGKYLKEIKERKSDLEGLPVLSVTNTQGFVLSEVFFDRKVYSKNLDNYKIVRGGQFAYNPSRLNVGSLAHLEEFEAGLLSPMYVVFEALPEVDGDFLYHWLSSGRAKNLIKASTQGTVRDSVSFSALSAFPIDLPPHSEQQKITAILGSVDRAIEKTRAVISQTYSLKKAIMQELLIRGIPGQHKRFKKTPIGEIPEEWEVMRLSEILTESRYGTSIKSHEGSEGIPILRIPNILNGKIDVTDLKFATLSANEVEKLKLIDGDILIVRTNGNPDYVGRCAVVENMKNIWIYASYLIRIRLDIEKVQPQFVRDYLKTAIGRRQMFGEIRTSAGNYNINTHGIGTILVPLPPVDEQAEIIELIKKIDTKYAIDSKCLEKFKHLKSALMQVLLTGEVRVKEI